MSYIKLEEDFAFKAFGWKYLKIFTSAMFFVTAQDLETSTPLLRNEVLVFMRGFVDIDASMHVLFCWKRKLFFTLNKIQNCVWVLKIGLNGYECNFYLRTSSSCAGVEMVKVKQKRAVAPIINLEVINYLFFFSVLRTFFTC